MEIFVSQRETLHALCTCQPNGAPSLKKHTHVSGATYLQTRLHAARAMLPRLLNLQRVAPKRGGPSAAAAQHTKEKCVTLRAISVKNMQVGMASVHSESMFQEVTYDVCRNLALPCLLVLCKLVC